MFTENMLYQSFNFFLGYLWSQPVVVLSWVS